METEGLERLCKKTANRVIANKSNHPKTRSTP